MSANWKDRYTETQLEKKRAADRLAQQRLRKESKRAAAELEQRLQLSIRGENAALIRHLLDENARLRSTVNYYRLRLGDIMAWSQDCLDYDPSSKETAAPTSLEKRAINRQVYQTTPVDPPPPISYHLSIYFQTTTLTGETGSALNNAVTMEAILESVTAWKLSNNCGFGLGFVFELFALDQSPDPCCTRDEVEWQVSSTQFYHHLLQALTTDKPFPSRGDDTTPRLSPAALSKVERQKRTAALCAYETIRQWRPFFASRHEWSAIFWSIFKYLEFLDFPTIGTLKETPHCLWPSHTQFSKEHPSFIDFLMWPRLRDALTAKSSEYEPNSLCLELVQNFELEKSEQVLKQPIFVLAPDAPGIMLNTGMRDVVYNPSNFRVRQGFERKYPDLGLCFAMENGQNGRRTCYEGSIAQAHPSGTATMEKSSINQTPEGTQHMNFRSTGQDFESVPPYEYTGFAENTVNRIPGDVVPDQNTANPLWSDGTGGLASAVVDFSSDRIWGISDAGHAALRESGEDVTTICFGGFI